MHQTSGCLAINIDTQAQFVMMYTQDCIPHVMSKLTPAGHPHLKQHTKSEKSNRAAHTELPLKQRTAYVAAGPTGAQVSSMFHLKTQLPST